MTELKKLFTPLNLIIVGVTILALLQFGIINLPFSTVNLTDPATNQTYTCISTYDCYQKVGSQLGGTDRAPALACKITSTASNTSNSSNTTGICIVQNCAEGETVTRTCPGGEIITISRCTNGQIDYMNDMCQPLECTIGNQSKQCISTADVDCDSQLDPLFGQCVSSKCQYAAAPRCADGELFWNKYKWYIISGGLILLGLGAFIFKGRIIKALK